MLARSWLYVPGDRGEMLEKALGRGADAVIVDLEDAVAPARKDAARDIVAGWLHRREREPRPQLWVRVNPGPLLADDVAAAAAPAVHGIFLPKATRAGVDALGRLLDRTGEESAHLRIAPLIESAAGVLELAEIAAARRVSHLAIGEADLGSELGVDPSLDGALQPLRLQLVVVSAAAGLAPPTAPVSTDFRDLDRLRESTRALRRLGFGGRSAIHPAQVAVINEVFTPSPDEVERARDLVSRFDAAVAEGRGVATDAEGRMIDEAVVRGARRTLALADAAGG